MLTLTLEATHAIAATLAGPEVPGDAGMRIGLDGTGSSNGGRRLHVAIAPGPSADDHVVEKAGARVFIPAPLADILADKCLDARVDDDDGVQFTLGGQSQVF